MSLVLPDDVIFEGGRRFQWLCVCLQALPFIDERRDHGRGQMMRSGLNLLS